MRTTVTLDPDTDAIVRALMREQGLSFKAALNQAIRAGAHPGSPVATRIPTRRLGRPRVELDRSLQLVGQLEDDEALRELRARR